MRLANSDTTVRPMRHVLDTKNCFLATTVAAPSYESGTSGSTRTPKYQTLALAGSATNMPEMPEVVDTKMPQNATEMS